MVIREEFIKEKGYSYFNNTVLNEYAIWLEKKITDNYQALQLPQNAVSGSLCVCGSNEISKTFIESGKWLGSSSSSMRKYSLNDKRFKTHEYSLGFDFYANGELLQTKCKECGKTDFVSL